MTTKKTAQPFQEGFDFSKTIKRHVCTDYRWQNGEISRLWHVDPESVELDQIIFEAIILNPSVQFYPQ